MNTVSTWFLVVYLLLASCLSFYVAYSLWDAKPLTAPGSARTPDCLTGLTARLTNINPNPVDVGSSPDVLLMGCEFAQSTVVKFNGTQHQALIVDASHIRVGLSAADVAGAGTVVITLSSGGADFGSGLLTVAPPGVYWQFFSDRRSITQDVQILLLMLFTGAFGSCVYALKSLGDYRGDGKLYQTWCTYYAIQPVEGAGIAYLFYLIARGGFLSVGVEEKTVNIFGMCAIAGLAGAFSDTAFLKLRELFQILFKPQDDRGGKLSPNIDTSSLSGGVAGKEYGETLQGSGGTAPEIKPAVTGP